MLPAGDVPRTPDVVLFAHLRRACLRARTLVACSPSTISIQGIVRADSYFVERRYLTPPRDSSVLAARRLGHTSFSSKKAQKPTPTDEMSAKEIARHFNASPGDPCPEVFSDAPIPSFPPQRLRAPGRTWPPWAWCGASSSRHFCRSWVRLG